MNAVFYLAAAVAVFSTVMVITRPNAVHALLYFIVSLFAVGLIFFLLGAPFVAVLEVIIYAGAIMVLFVFVVMLLNLGPQAAAVERQWLSPGIWIGPALLSAVLLGELVVVVTGGAALRTVDPQTIAPKAVSETLFGPYVLGVELGSMLLLAGLIGAYHLGRREQRLETPPSHREAGGTETT